MALQSGLSALTLVAITSLIPHKCSKLNTARKVNCCAVYIVRHDRLWH